MQSSSVKCRSPLNVSFFDDKKKKKKSRPKKEKGLAKKKKYRISKRALIKETQQRKARMFGYFKRRYYIGQCIIG